MDCASQRWRFSHHTGNVIPLIHQPASFRRDGAWIALLITGAAILAVTNRSFWIDECFVAELVKQPTLMDCWRTMKHFPEVQMPFYMSYLWAYAHVFGTGEWIMRAAGLPWFVAGAIVFSISLGRVIASAFVPALLISSSAFAWYYLNEARVYSIQLGFALALVGAGADVIRTLSTSNPSKSSWRLFLVTLFLLCGTSALAAVWGFFLFGGFLSLVPRTDWIRLWRLAPRSLIMSGVALGALAAYYGWTLTLHPDPTRVGTTTLQTLVFVFYELCGAAGLGPARNDLRAAGVGALKPFLAPLLLFGFLTSVICWNGLRELSSRFGAKRLLVVTLMSSMPFLLICALGLLTRFRVLGRHATPMLPLLLLVMTFGLVHLLRQRRFLSGSAAGGFLLLSLISCFCIRFSSRHEKDDYRSAAAIAREATLAGKHVWWNAEVTGAAYYQLKGRDGVTILGNPSIAELRNRPEPDLVVVSKPDIYDTAGGVAEYIRAQHYRVSARLPAFVIWAKEP
jgi:hypothetical protein